METTFQIAEQIGARGFYARVSITCKYSLKSNLIVSYGSAFTKWKYSIEFACDYIFNHIKGSRGLEINIIDIEDNPVDTSSIVVVFALIKAIESHLDLQRSSLVEFDKINGVFKFMK